MRGRKPKPGSLRAKQGNPGRRKIQPDVALAAAVSPSLPFVTLTGAAHTAYENIGRDLRAMNFIRATDEPALLRYCGLLGLYWELYADVDANGTTERVKTVSGDHMTRTRPQVKQMMEISGELLKLEMNLGMTPMARQNYLTRMANVGAGAQRELPPQQPPSETTTISSPPPAPAAPAIGFLKPSTALN